MERIVLELKDKVGVASAWEAAAGAEGTPSENSLKNDAVLALISLGYKQAEAHRAVGKACSVDSMPTNADDILRAALRQLQ